MDPKGAPLLPRLLPVHEAATRSIRSGDFAGGAADPDRAASALGSQPLDRGDRMIPGRVLGRLLRASREGSFSVPAPGLLGSPLEVR